jgi:thioester reductase-like protein
VTTVFLTGFPGFLGSALVDRLLDRYGAGDVLACLVQPRYRETAAARADALTAADSAAADEPTVVLHEGDITDPDLGLAPAAAETLRAETAEVFHLAAVYDLGVDEAVGRAVNVRGTEHVLDLAADCPRLNRFHHVSTCYVSGRYDGVFTESMLREGQSFNNHYERTKHAAEVAVRSRMAGGLPATVYRPAIAVGDSETGETDKYDGPYYVLRLLLRQPRVAVLPLPPRADRYEMNVVPRDYVVDAVAHLSGLDRSAGVVYQLADPNPPSVAEVSRLLATAADRRLVALPVAGRRPARAFASLRGVSERLGVEPEALAYFTHPTRYATGNARRDLAGTDVAVPPFASYVDALVSFVRENPDVGAEAMV